MEKSGDSCSDVPTLLSTDYSVWRIIWFLKTISVDPRFPKDQALGRNLIKCLSCNYNLTVNPKSHIEKMVWWHASIFPALGR